MKKPIRNVLGSSGFQRAVGFLAAEYLRLVWLTNKFSLHPANAYELVEPAQPVIFAFWHGQHLLTPFLKTKESQRAKVLISRHRDGEFNALVVERLGIRTIRGSGDHGGAFYRKAGSVRLERCWRRSRRGIMSPRLQMCPSARASRDGHRHVSPGIRTADHTLRHGD